MSSVQLQPQQKSTYANSHFITVLKVESTTWSRDSHELFDYESRHVTEKKFLLRKHARVFRNPSEVEIVPDGHPLPSNADYLLSVKAKDGRFYVYPADRNVGGQNLQPRKLWLIIKHLPLEHYPLNEGDIIKLGRFKLRVKQIVTETDGSNSAIDFKLDDVEVPASDLTPEESQNMQCRICLLEGGVDEDPLVRACQCKGSIMYVHLDCLRHWVNGRLNLTEDTSRTCCFIRQLQCELCKSPYPSTVTSRGVRLPIVKVPNVQPPFIVLENMVGPQNRGVHLCSMAVKKECKLGRGHESDVRIADVSISRFHAMIRYQEGSFYLQDHTSKFGTLVALRKPTVVETTERLSVQVGRTVLHFTLELIPNHRVPLDVTELTDSPRQQQHLSQQQQLLAISNPASGSAGDFRQPDTPRQPSSSNVQGGATMNRSFPGLDTYTHFTPAEAPSLLGGGGYNMLSLLPNPSEAIATGVALSNSPVAEPPLQIYRNNNLILGAACNPTLQPVEVDMRSAFASNVFPGLSEAPRPLHGEEALMGAASARAPPYQPPTSQEMMSPTTPPPPLTGMPLPQHYRVSAEMEDQILGGGGTGSAEVYSPQPGGGTDLSRSRM